MVFNTDFSHRIVCVFIVGDRLNRSSRGILCCCKATHNRIYNTSNRISNLTKQIFILLTGKYSLSLLQLGKNLIAL